ncbi:MAG: four helix bundle suffix domain-containing protein [Candidatus Daviesbacteria bacterium]|nr:four helix bundle suffix domain-containing protein [Candidatus Daviesbacteria bacterium]
MVAKHKYLLTYRFSEIIHDLTVEFIRKYIDYKSRTRDQMEQAARSGKQNIVEGVGFGRTSKKIEIKLLGVAMASLEELITDLEDFLRQRNLKIWIKNDFKVLEFKKITFRLSNLSNLGPLGNLIEKPILPQNPEEAANFLLTLCHQATYLLNRQIQKAEEDFIEKGGYSENLFKKRLEERGK